MLYYSGQAWRNSFNSGLQYVARPGVTYETATLGNKSESFEGGIPKNGNGSIATGEFWQLKDGTGISFGKVLYHTDDDPEDSSYFTEYRFADSITYPDGVKVTLHYKDGYDGSGLQSRVQSVTTNTGYQLKYHYQSDNIADGVSAWTSVTKVVAINNAVEYCNPEADSCALSGNWPEALYSTSGGYRYATDAQGGQTRIQSGSTFSVKTPNSAGDNRIYSIGTTYDPSAEGIVAKVTQASIDGKTVNYSFSYSTGSYTSTVTASGPLSDGRVYVAGFKAPGISSFANALNRTTQFTYDGYGRIKTIVSPEGNWTEYIYDDGGNPYWNPRGNVATIIAHPKTGSGLASLSEQWSFVAACDYTNYKICNKPASYTDPNGNVTIYQYDGAHGGKLRETLPAATVDGQSIQPVKRYAYGLRQAYVKNPSGNGFVATDGQVSMLTEERTCLATATVGNACVGGSADEVITTYEYGSQNGSAGNNLLVRGKVVTHNGESRRTCYAYDVLGNKISETLPSAGLASCP